MNYTSATVIGTLPFPMTLKFDTSELSKIMPNFTNKADSGLENLWCVKEAIVFHPNEFTASLIAAYEKCV